MQNSTGPRMVLAVTTTVVIIIIVYLMYVWNVFLLLFMFLIFCTFFSYRDRSKICVRGGGRWVLFPPSFPSLLPTYPFSCHLSPLSLPVIFPFSFRRYPLLTLSNATPFSMPRSGSYCFVTGPKYQCHLIHHCHCLVNPYSG